MSEIIKQDILINETYLREYSIIPKNYDLQEVMNYCKIAEEIHILPIIGIALYDELIDQVKTNTLTPLNSTLILEIYRVEGVATVYECLPFCWARLNETGITLGKSDNSDSVENSDMNYIQNHLKKQLEYLKINLNNFLMLHQDKYPLFKPKGNRRDFEIYGLSKDNIDIQ